MKKYNTLFSIIAALLIMVTACEEPGDEGNNDPNLITVEENINSDEIWIATRKYYINTAIHVSNGANLTVQPGTEIKFGPDGSLNIGYLGNATFLAVGDIENPILFTSSAKDPTAGSWNYIYFGSNTLQNTTLSYCIFEYGGKEAYYGVLAMHECRISVNNCTFRQNNGDQTLLVEGEDETSGFGSFTENIFTGNSGHAIRIPAQYLHQINSNNAIACIPGKGVAINGDFKQTSATLNKLSVPYISENPYGTYIEGSLAIAPGTILMFSGEDYLGLDEPNARLVANGTDTERIVFTTSSSSPAPGAWTGIIFFDQAHPDCILNNCDILYAGRDSYYRGAITINDIQVTVSNCKIQNSSKYAIYLIGETASLSSASVSNTITNCALGETGSE